MPKEELGARVIDKTIRKLDLRVVIFLKNNSNLIFLDKIFHLSSESSEKFYRKSQFSNRFFKNVTTLS